MQKDCSRLGRENVEIRGCDAPSFRRGEEGEIDPIIHQGKVSILTDLLIRGKLFAPLSLPSPGEFL